MNETRSEQTQTLELDFQRLAGALWQKKWVIAVVSVLCAAAMGLGTWFFVTPQYKSSAMFYVNNYATISDTTGTITSSDITASKDLVDSYIVILNTQSSLDEIIRYAGVNRDAEDLEDMLEASAVNSTEIFRVTVTSPDPQEALKIAQAITQVLPQRITSILDGTSAKVVDDPRLATRPSSPNYVLSTLLGFVMGMALSLVVVILRQVFDVTIRSEEDVTMNCELPILSAVPDMETTSKGGYYTSDKSKGKSSAERVNAQVGAAVPFSVSEAYKLLRTKVQFSFADDNDCHVIGVSSALAGEGKSTSAVNLAYSLAQMNNRVLLMDCDLRRPTVPTKLRSVAKTPGLTNFLTRQVPISDVIQGCTLDDVTFSVISAGSIPPNPIELLGSERMRKTMTALRQSFDYIIMDLPPVGEVSDAMTAAKMVDGILLVVRQNYCNRPALANAIQQFRFVEARILGVVVSCAEESGVGYSKKYYKKYYKGAYSPYKSSYAASAKRAAQKQRK